MRYDGVTALHKAPFAFIFYLLSDIGVDQSPQTRILMFPLVATAFLRRKKAMNDIRIGIVGGGYMGKAHAVAYAAVASVFTTELRPILELSLIHI